MTGIGSRKRSLFRRVVPWLVVLAAITAGIAFLGPWRKSKAPTVPTAEIKMGEFVDYVELRGEVRARSSTVIKAPFNAGDLLILKLCPNGTTVKKGDLIVQFDPSTLQRSLDQNRTALRQAEAEIEKLQAQQRIHDEQIQTDVTTAQFNIERARLDASAYEVLTPIEIEKSRLALGKAEQKMHEVDAKIASERVGAAADLAAAEKKRAKAQNDLKQSEGNMQALTLSAPIDGIITLRRNYRASSGLMTNAYPVFKAGDRTYSGAEIAELPELATIEVNAQVAEAERGKLALEQPVNMRVDAVPDKEHKGHVGAISPLAQLDYSSWPIKKSFDLTVHLENPDPRLRPGMSATVRIAVERLPNSILVPAEALFEKGGRTVAYVLANGNFEQRDLDLIRRGDDHAVVTRGVKPGERVALKDPTQARDQD